MDPGPTISRPYIRHKWVGRMICSQAIVSARAQDLLRLPESMTIIKNRTDTLRFSFPLIPPFLLGYVEDSLPQYPEPHHILGFCNYIPHIMNDNDLCANSLHPESSSSAEEYIALQENPQLSLFLVILPLIGVTLSY